MLFPWSSCGCRSLVSTPKTMLMLCKAASAELRPHLLIHILTLLRGKELSDVKETEKVLALLEKQILGDPQLPSLTALLLLSEHRNDDKKGEKYASKLRRRLKKEVDIAATQREAGAHEMGSVVEHLKALLASTHLKNRASETSVLLLSIASLVRFDHVHVRGTRKRKPFEEATEELAESIGHGENDVDVILQECFQHIVPIWPADDVIALVQHLSGALSHSGLFL